MLIRDWAVGDVIKIGEDVILTRTGEQRIGIVAPKCLAIEHQELGKLTRQPVDRPHRERTGDEKD